MGRLDDNRRPKPSIRRRFGRGARRATAAEARGYLASQQRVAMERGRRVRRHGGRLHVAKARLQDIT
jgi:hypothetical protein